MKSKKRKSILPLTQEAYENAKQVVRVCSTKNGLYASGGIKGYKGVWSRDSNITLLGASTDSSEEFKEVWKQSLETLKKHQSQLGQIPNAVLKFRAKERQVDFKSIDSSLWFIIGHHLYKKRYKDASLFKSHKHALAKALLWLHYRDFWENATLEQLPTSDWQDAFPNKYGATLNTQALYYFVLSLVNDKKRLKVLSKEVNVVKEDRLWNGTFYWAYRWKNHNKYKEIGEWFDSLGNMMAIVFGLADKKKSRLILDYVKRQHIAQPYPMKAIAPPIKPGSVHWEDYYYDARATPGHYLNGGIWPFIGGFYILALVRMKRYSEAEEELERYAEGCLKAQLFPEWIDPKTKATWGQLQAWSAGMYMWAYNAVKKKNILL